jgi:hypothetical protein
MEMRLRRLLPVRRRRIMAPGEPVEGENAKRETV